MSADLPRRIGFWGGSAIMVGIIIGSGIFQTPPDIAKGLGSPALILCLWVVGGALSLSGALIYAELSTMFPRSGGMYVYLNEGLGSRVSFTFGWTYLLLLKPFAAGAVSITLANHVNSLFGTSWSTPAIAGVAIVVLTGVNVVSVKGSFSHRSKCWPSPPSSGSVSSWPRGAPRTFPRSPWGSRRGWPSRRPCA
jgi:amino acid transporter